MFLKITFIILILSLICMILKFESAKHESLKIVTIENGKITGENLDDYYAFRGIPYAEPPIGKLRFAPPARYTETWTGLRSFKNFSSVCAQYYHFGYLYEGSEDCLTLNVFVPKSVLESNETAPVIFFIHGGAFMFGGGHVYGPENIMKAQNMILVTINYRLGVLGFLSTEDDVIPGNFGLKDQVAALQWVKRNIRSFNGDPDKVTITGFSAGGSSVHLHYMSPLSRGLFNNGISHSGVAINPWVMMEKVREKSHQLAAAVDCPMNDHQALLECLRTKPTENLVMFAKKFQPFLYNPFSPFGIVVEAPHDGAFLTDHPMKILKSGNLAELPWILSQTEDEGLYPAREFFNDEYLKEINDKWEDLAPFLLDFNSTTTAEKFKLDVSRKIRKFYFQDREINKKSYADLRLMMSDRLYHNGAYETLKLQSNGNENYFYYFRFKAEEVESPEKQKYESKISESLGVSHGDDVFLIYLPSFRNGTPYFNDKLTVSQNLINLYFNFASNNSAVYDHLVIDEVHGDDIRGLEIFTSKNFSMESIKIGHEDFWKSLEINDA